MTPRFQTLEETSIDSPRNSKFTLTDATVQLPDGTTAVWQYIKNRGAVCLIPIQTNKIFCVRQWRPARQDYVWELPAGGLDTSDPAPIQVLENANRELREEIGYKANRLEILTSFTPSVHFTGTYYIVLAADLVESPLPKDPGEEIEVRLLPYSEAYDLLIRRQLPTALNLIALQLAQAHLVR